MSFSYPPYAYLEQVLLNCPKASLLYWKLWRHKDSENKIHIFKHDLYEIFGFSVKKFNHDLMLLTNQGLVSSVFKQDRKIEIELVGWDDYDEDNLLCL